MHTHTHTHTLLEVEKWCRMVERDLDREGRRWQTFAITPPKKKKKICTYFHSSQANEIELIHIHLQTEKKTFSFNPTISSTPANSSRQTIKTATVGKRASRSVSVYTARAPAVVVFHVINKGLTSAPVIG